MPDEHVKAADQLNRVVDALEAQAEALEPIASFFETLDLALTEHMGDSQRVNAHSFIRAYQQAARELEEPEPESGE